MIVIHVRLRGVVLPPSEYTAVRTERAIDWRLQWGRCEASGLPIAEERFAQLKNHLEHLRRIEAAAMPPQHGSDGAGEHAIERRAI
jgi:hypothetical protein